MYNNQNSERSTAKFKKKKKEGSCLLKQSTNIEQQNTLDGNSAFSAPCDSEGCGIIGEEKLIIEIFLLSLHVIVIPPSGKKRGRKLIAGEDFKYWVFMIICLKVSE